MIFYFRSKSIAAKNLFFFEVAFGVTANISEVRNNNDVTFYTERVN